VFTREESGFFCLVANLGKELVGDISSQQAVTVFGEGGMIPDRIFY
jgi:hypothetical protein